MVRPGAIGTVISYVVLWLLGYGLAGLAALSIDPAMPPWGYAVPALILVVVGLLAIPLYRGTRGWVRWAVLAVYLAVPLYVALQVIWFHVVW